MSLLAGVLAFALQPMPGLAGERKLLPVSIRLMSEGNEKDGSSFVNPIDLTMPAKRVFLRKIPIVSEGDVRAFYPFQAADGTVGAYFRLDSHGSDRLMQYTIEERGKLAVVMVCGRVACVLQVTDPVNDGLLYVPSGLRADEIPRLAQKYAVIGREAEFGKKDAHKTPLPQFSTPVPLPSSTPTPKKP